MVVPHNAAGGVYTFRVPAWLVYSSVVMVFLFIVIVSSSIVYTSSLSRRLLHYRMTLKVNEEQKQQIDFFSCETSQVKQAIAELVDRDNELRKMLGIEAKKPSVDLMAGPAPVAKPKLADVESAVSEKMSKISSDLTVVDRSLEERKESLEALKEKVKYIRTRFSHTPSIWPIYGRLVSRFGYRYSPWRGFHTGIDITSWYGAPIRAAADGVVTYAGWRGGYGKTVMIDHGYGVISLYGHTSKIAVSLGSRVRKGQVIAYIGATGLATGPHLHYELRKNGYLADPINYLNLDIFSASKAWSKEK